MSDFHAKCLEAKVWLDSQFPEGASAVLAFVATAVQMVLNRIGFSRWVTGRVGSELAAKVLSRGPAVVVTTLWGWMTLGVFQLDVAAKGFVAGVLGPSLLLLMGNPPSNPPGGSGDGTPEGGPLTMRTGAASALMLVAALIACDAKSPSAWDVELCRLAVRADFGRDTEACQSNACIDARSASELEELRACWDKPRDVLSEKARKGIDLLILQEQLLQEKQPIGGSRG